MNERQKDGLGLSTVGGYVEAREKGRDLEIPTLVMKNDGVNV